MFVDAFNGGHVVGRSDLEWLLQKLSGGRLQFSPEFLDPATPRQVLVRMLQNLKGIAHSGGDFMRVVELTDRILALDATLVDEYAVRGTSYAHLGADAFALADYQRYLERCGPEGEYRSEVEKRVAALQGRPRGDWS